MKIKTPFHHLRYKGITSRGYYWRTPRMALKVWWEWDVEPWFKKKDYLWGEESKPFYRWQTWFEPLKSKQWIKEVIRIDNYKPSARANADEPKS